MQQPSRHSFQSGRLQLNYVQWGSPTAEPVVLIHGLMDHCRNWDAVAQELAQRYWVIAPDLRGHGDSDWALGSSYPVEDYLQDLHRLLDLFDEQAVTLVGHSMGGGIASKYAGLWPHRVKRLVSIEGLGAAPHLVEKEAQWSMSERMQRWMTRVERIAHKAPRHFDTQEAAIARMQQANSHLSDELARHLAVHGSRQNEEGHYVWKYDPFVGAHPPLEFSVAQTHALWSKIDCPVLLIWGEDSWAKDPEQDGRTQHFKDVRLVRIAGAGHWVQHDQFEAFMSALNAFLAS